MFETLFSAERVLRRHRDGPLAAQRAAYLQDLVSCGLAPSTLRVRARHCLRIATSLSTWPPDHLFSTDEVAALDPRRLASGKALRPPVDGFRSTALELLSSLGRLRMDPPCEHDDKLNAFIAFQRETSWQSEETCLMARPRIQRFLNYLHQRGVVLGAASPADIDGFFEEMAQVWSRKSLATAAWAIRKWLHYSGRRGWARPGLDAAVLVPRLYCREGLPLGPTWDTVSHMLAATEGDDPAAIRDHAILLLLSVYGVRSGEVRRLHLDDIDWAGDRITFERSKSHRRDLLPLHPLVGEAIARYLSQSRPRTDSRIVFLRVRPPHTPLTTCGLHAIVDHCYPEAERPSRGRGPHGLRHACARHLVEAGHSFKEVGDHLGHRSPDSAGIYAKVDLRSLRQVAPDDLGGLA